MTVRTVRGVRKYVAEDGQTFFELEECAAYEAEVKKRSFWKLVAAKMIGGPFEAFELTLPCGRPIDCLPFLDVNWMGASNISSITSFRRRKSPDGLIGPIEFQIGDADGVPYPEGTEWALMNEFINPTPGDSR